MGGRGGASVQSREMHPEYARAVESATVKIKTEEKETKARTQRIKSFIKATNDGISKYAKKNADWKKKVQESERLARQGKLAEANKAYEEGRKIYESIPKDFRKD